MTTPVLPDLAPDSAPHLADETIALVNRWLAEASTIPASVAAQRLAGVLSDPKGLEFTTGFVDGVVRPEDTRVAAHALARVAPLVPGFLPAPLRGAVRVGGVAGQVAPGVVVPIARKVLRRMVGHLIADARDEKLGKAITALKRDGVRLNLNLLGEAVLGATRGAAPARGHDAPARARRRRLRLGQGLVDRRPALAVGLRRGRRRDHRRRLTPLFRLAAPPHDAEVHQPRHGGVPRPRPHDRGLHAAARRARVPQPRGRHRPAGLPARRARRHDPPAGVGGGTPCAGRRRHQGAPGEGREPLDGAGRRRDARLAARDLGHQAGDRHQLQAGPRLRPASPSASRNVPHRRRRPQPLRHRLRVAARQPSAGSRDGVEFEMLLGMAESDRRGRRGARSAGSCSTRPSCTPASSTSRSRTWSAASRRAPRATTSCRRSSSSTRHPACSSARRERFLASLRGAR